MNISMKTDIYVVSVTCNHTHDTETQVFFRKKPAYQYFNQLANSCCYIPYDNIHREDDYINIAFAGGEDYDFYITLSVQELHI